MSNQIFVSGSLVKTTAANLLGSGTEADVYKIAGGLALKVFKTPQHPDYQGFPKDQEAARDRIKVHERKLSDFPKNLPPRVVAPIAVATDSSGAVAGYTMKMIPSPTVLMKLSQPSFRKTGYSDSSVVQVFKDLQKTVDGIHRASVVIGDFNDLNILVSKDEAYVLDADSFQFGPYYCSMFTQEFVDPTIIRPTTVQERQGSNLGAVTLANPHNPLSDWYAFNVLLFQSFMLIGPYGGVYIPKSSADRLKQPERPLKRITVFNEARVRYPKKARSWKILPDDWIDYFKAVFEKDKRECFPYVLLENMHWVICSKCGTAHSRTFCPECAAPVVRPVVHRKTGLIVTQVFSTSGIIRFAVMQGNRLHFVYQDQDQVLHKSASVSGQINKVAQVVNHTSTPLKVVPETRFRIQGESTLVGVGNRLVIVTPNESPKLTMVDSYLTSPMFDANRMRKYWIENGQLMRDGQFGPEMVGTVLPNQTNFWVGNNFGFGFYKVGGILTGFLFDAERLGINDYSLQGKLPQTRGQIIDATCVFTSTRCWFFTSSLEGTQKVNRVAVIRRDGGTVEVEATAEALEGDGSWLGWIHGKCATGNILLAPTDEGVVRLQIVGGQIVQKEIFDGTDQYVQEGSYLRLAPDDSLFVMNYQTIIHLAIN